MFVVFQLSCKTGHEERAYNVCELMGSSHSVQLAIKYASRLRRLQLAERLSQLAHLMLQRETGEVEDDDTEEDAWADTHDLE